MTTAKTATPMVIEGINFDPRATYMVLMATDMSHRIVVDGRVKTHSHSIDYRAGMLKINDEMPVGDMTPGMWASFKKGQEIVSGSKKTWIVTKAIPDIFEHRGLVEQIIKEAKGAGCDQPVFTL